jgi:hypothetical protein
MLAENKDPSGGTTGRVKPYGRLGWMGARAEYSLDGEGLPLPPVLVAEGHPDVQRWFKNFLAHEAGIFERRLSVSASNLRAFGAFSVTACDNAAPPKHAAIAIWTRGLFVKREGRAIPCLHRGCVSTMPTALHCDPRRSPRTAFAGHVPTAYQAFR